mmetsp:Transcript_11431/g.38989  ORF Transcript_11431/g.38989 Transcript_11431/m.38989 type:complete len:154 (-) Transcript_11431:126-587(-)
MSDIALGGGRVRVPEKRNESVLDVVLVGDDKPGTEAFVQVTTASAKRVKLENMCGVAAQFDTLLDEHDKKRRVGLGKRKRERRYVLIVPPERFPTAKRPALLNARGKSVTDAEINKRLSEYNLNFYVATPTEMPNKLKLAPADGDSETGFEVD